MDNLAVFSSALLPKPISDHVCSSFFASIIVLTTFFVQERKSYIQVWINNLTLISPHEDEGENLSEEGNNSIQESILVTDSSSETSYQHNNVQNIKNPSKLSIPVVRAGQAPGIRIPWEMGPPQVQNSGYISSQNRNLYVDTDLGQVIPLLCNI